MLITICSWWWCDVVANTAFDDDTSYLFLMMMMMSVLDDDHDENDDHNEDNGDSNNNDTQNNFCLPWSSSFYCYAALLFPITKIFIIIIQKQIRMNDYCHLPLFPPLQQVQSNLSLFFFLSALVGRWIQKNGLFGAESCSLLRNHCCLNHSCYHHCCISSFLIKGLYHVWVE